ncbi:hypothetical protein BDV93DRAFT_550156 [Ceratobasidium sp. AG-I]|nr:hypothetical protein BDV93DRAFT_550156 [Ceratobasidium sp. AG-I]
MIIPGSPPTWKEPELPLQLNPGPGDPFIDQDAAHCPQNPLEPMIQAISVTQKALGKDFKLADERIDVVADRNSLRKLLRFVRANGPDRDPRPVEFREFRIDAQLAPNARTLVFIPHEGSDAGSSRSRGVGYNFKRATTMDPAPLVATNDTRTRVSRLQPTSYHRVIRYDLLGLRFLVRSEVDAMLPASGVEPEAVKAEDLEDLVNAFTHTSISDSTVPPKPVPAALNQQATIVNIDGSKLRYVSNGELIPQSSIIDVRTVTGRGVAWSDVYPQLLLSQISTTKLATQLKGRIDTIQTYNNKDEVLQERRNRMNPDLKGLTTVLTQIRDVARNPQNQGKHLALCWSGSGDMKIFAMPRGGHLPEEMDLKVF